jgi:hypothetical protein
LFEKAAGAYLILMAEEIFNSILWCIDDEPLYLSGPEFFFREEEDQKC